MDNNKIDAKELTRRHAAYAEYLRVKTAYVPQSMDLLFKGDIQLNGRDWTKINITDNPGHVSEETILANRIFRPYLEKALTEYKDALFKIAQVEK